MSKTKQRRERGQRLGRVLIAIWKGDFCRRCGRSFPPEQLQLHHRPGTEKRFNIGDWSQHAYRSLDLLVAELRKTEALCGGCHIAEHREEFRQRAAARTRDNRGRFLRAEAA